MYVRLVPLFTLQPIGSPYDVGLSIVLVRVISTHRFCVQVLLYLSCPSTSLTFTCVTSCTTVRYTVVPIVDLSPTLPPRAARLNISLLWTLLFLRRVVAAFVDYTLWWKLAPAAAAAAAAVASRDCVIGGACGEFSSSKRCSPTPNPVDTVAFILHVCASRLTGDCGDNGLG